jgi:hypothetical protein
MAGPLDYEPITPKTPGPPGHWVLPGVVAGVVLCLVAIYVLVQGDDRALRSIGIPSISALVIPFALGLSFVGASDQVVIAIGIVQSPIELGLVGWLIERRRYGSILVLGIIHLALTAWLSWRWL